LAAFEYLSGAVGCLDEQKQLQGRIVRAVLVGNSVASTATSDDLFGTKGSLRVQTRQSVSGMTSKLDVLLNELGQSMEVDVMPGQSDPSNFALPQFSIHHSFFP
jgi:DNA polymerase delta subunit 2